MSKKYLKKSLLLQQLHLSKKMFCVFVSFIPSNITGRIAAVVQPCVSFAATMQLISSIQSMQTARSKDGDAIANFLPVWAELQELSILATSSVPAGAIGDLMTNLMSDCRTRLEEVLLKEVRVKLASTYQSGGAAAVGKLVSDWPADKPAAIDNVIRTLTTINELMPRLEAGISQPEVPLFSYLQPFVSTVAAAANLDEETLKTFKADELVSSFTKNFKDIAAAAMESFSAKQNEVLWLRMSCTDLAYMNSL